LYLIAALGNPGKKYRHTRHNIGFWALETLGRRHGITVEKKKFEGCYGSGVIDRIQVLLLTPLTYMNRSGVAVAAFLRYFRIPPEQLIVLHDDLDLPWNTLRISEKRGAAGHKGVLSIIQELQTHGFIRVRIGIGRPPLGVAPEDYVLEPFTPSEEADLPALTERAAEAVETILTQGVIAAMNRFNVRPTETSPSRP
jgi:PTH1 family peptidyl-tRNA hydrolase